MQQYKINKPVRLIELFSGYQSQFMAMKRLGVDCVSWRTSEWDVNSVRSAHAIHCSENTTDYSAKFSKEELVNKLYQLGISADGKSPLAKDKIARKGESWLRQVFNDFIATKNLGSITNIHAKHLGIKNQDEFSYLLTYSFPCFTGDTLVLTKDGYKEIKDINIGDYVLTHDNTYQKVLDSQCMGKKEIWHIKAMGIDGIDCTENHLFLIRKCIHKVVKKNGKRHIVRKFTEPEFVKAKDLTTDMLIGIAINQNSITPKWNGTIYYNTHKEPYVVNNISNELTNHNFWWLIGRYLGDGWYLEGKYGCTVVISVRSDQLKIVEDKITKCNFKYTIREYERSAQKVYISNKELVEYVKQFGKGAYNKFIPGFMFDMPIEYLQSFIIGYESADGSVNKRGRRVATSVSKKLIYGMTQLIAKAYNRPYSIYDNRREFTVIIDGKERQSHGVYTYDWKMDKRKNEHGNYYENQLWQPIRSITKTNQIEDVYDITVNNNHTFTANGIIVHNCQDLSLAGKQAGMDENSGTRSALIWEVGRLLRECKEEHCLPDVLVMENVKALINKKNMPNFQKWLDVLDDIGYTSYYSVLNAKDFGVAQNRERVFCLSILGNYEYTFPEPIPLKKRLKDYLEDNVDEKYYISSEKADKLVGNLIDRGVLPRKENTYSLKNMGSSDENREPDAKPTDVAGTILARDYKGLSNYASNGVIDERE